MKLYRAYMFITLYKTYEACNDLPLIGLRNGGRIGELPPDTKFIVLESIGRSRSIVSGNQVGWIWVSDGSLASMEVTES